MRDFLRSTLTVALTLCGTMIGAGFASGQELLQFFIAYGRFGIAGVAFAGALFAAVAWRLLAVSHARRLQTHLDLIYLLCGRRTGRFFDFAVAAFLFVLFVLMLAAARAAAEASPMPPGLAGAALAALAVCAALRGSAGVARINSAAAPLLAATIALVCGSSLSHHGWHPGLLEEAAALSAQPAPHWLLGCALYVAYNFALGATVLVPLGRNVRKPAARAAGSILGGALLAGLSLLIVLTLLMHTPHIFAQQIPMLHISCTQSAWHAALYSLVLLLSMFTTASACLYGCACKLRSATSWSAPLCLFCCACAALALSGAGFSRIIAVLFPLFGYLSLFLLVRLFALKLPR